ncbi:hypothetical protein [Actinomadura nitritigenes]|uniref:hypothetical protein n=1 Tax=Actinomadura nitritigenes TaxID=134602 RepID=UPI003D94264D
MSVRVRPEAPGIAAFRGGRPTTAASRPAAVDGALGLKAGTATERRRLALAAEPVPWRDAGSRGPHRRRSRQRRRLAVRLVRSPAIRRPRAGVNSAPVWRYAHDMGMKVYFQTGTLALSPPLKRYLVDIDTSSPPLWSVTPAGTTAPRSR